MDSAGDREHRAEDGHDNEDMTAPPAVVRERLGGHGERTLSLSRRCQRGGVGSPARSHSSRVSGSAGPR